MSSTFSVALSALQAQSEAINTTGNNLANLNTTGFKGSAVSFKDLFSESLGGSSTFQVGLGVGVPISDTAFSQGPIQTSTSLDAVAIQGNGFFVVNGPSNQPLYTRDGNFKVSASGTLQTQTGEQVQGWMANANGVNAAGAPSNITLSTGAVLPPKIMQNLSISANLNAGATIGSNDGNVQVPVQVVDSLGNQHTLTFSFTKTAANSWSYDVTVPGADLTGGTAGAQQSLLSAPGTLTFDTNGNLSISGGTGPTTLTLSGLADGASNMSVNWSHFDPTGAGLVTQYAETSASTSSQDGLQAGQLTQVAIQTGGAGGCHVL